MPSTLLNPDTGFEVPGFHMGETEDYRFPRLPFPPGLLIAKTVHTPIANTGDTLRYRVLITNTNQLSVPVVFWDPIPPGTVYVDQSFGFNLPALFWGHDPVSNALYWHGELGPGQTLDLSFSVHVVRCETFGFTVLNEALAFEPGRPPVTAAAATAIGDCITPPNATCG
ncbi:MAG: DUF11 domain-containing protein [Anaerolineae bacterium]